MVADAQKDKLDALIARLAATEPAEARLRLLEEAMEPESLWELAERLKVEADTVRYQDRVRSLRWSDDIVALGQLAEAPTVVALGRMVEGLTLQELDRYSDSLARFDEASELFRAHGHEVGWARTQIGRMNPCRFLGRQAEALERAQEARAILEQAGDRLRVATLDHNVAVLLERTNRPAEALEYSRRALAVYRDADSAYHVATMLGAQALLLWRLGRVREALDAHEEARQTFLALGAATDVAREDLNIGLAALSLGHYAEAVSRLTAARDRLLAMQSSYLAAFAGLYLAECWVRLGRFGQALASTASLADQFVQFGTTADGVQALVWEALAHTGLGAHERAVRSVERAAALLASNEATAAFCTALAIVQAQLLCTIGQLDEARALLTSAIPDLRQSGLAIEAAVAQVLWGGILLEDGLLQDAGAAADEASAMAENLQIDWLAERALHLRGRVALRTGDTAGAWRHLATALRHSDRAQRRVAWDDRAAFASTAADLHADAIALALELQQPAVALRYAERAKARALADHLRGGIDIRLRPRDEHSQALIEELQALRERYAWLAAAQARQSSQAIPAAVRWATGMAPEPEHRAEIARIEHRMAEIWRELQAANPAYRGEAAALDLAEEESETGDDVAAAQCWLSRLHAALSLEGDTALLEYASLGDDLVLFVVRAGEVHALRLTGAGAEVRRLVPLLRLNVERSAAIVAGGSHGALHALGANARGLLARLYAILLAPATPLLDGAARLVVAPQGSAHHVPFHALHDGRSFLIEHVEVAYAPCAGLIEHFAERHHHLSGARQGHDPTALVLTCSAGGALPHVAAEGEAVIAAHGGRLLREDEATLDNLRSLAANCTVLHLAAHGVFRPDEPLFSALQLADGQLSTMDVFHLDLRCSLATLSACETALGRAGAGDELMGLSRAFLYAGAPSLVLSLWKVEDSTTAALMGVFYQALRRGAGKAAALRQAQLALLHNETGIARDCSAPFLWAPFSLIGHAGPL